MRSFLKSLLNGMPDNSVTELCLDKTVVEEYGNPVFTKIEGLENYKDLKVLSISKHQLQAFEMPDQLQNLKELNLSHNDISSFNPCKLPGLQELDLSFNNLEELTNFPYCEELSWLNLSFNGLTSVSDLPYLPNLTSFALSGNPIRSLNGLVKKIPQVKHLYLRNCPVSSLDPIRELELSTLSVSPTNSQIGMLPATKTLMLNGLKIQGKIRFSGNDKLEALTLKNTGKIEIGSDLNCFPSLTKLSLSFTGLEKLPPLPASLKELDISFNQVNDLEPLKRLTSLNKLRIEGNPINQNELSEIKARSQELEIR